MELFRFGAIFRPEAREREREEKTRVAPPPMLRRPWARRRFRRRSGGGGAWHKKVTRNARGGGGRHALCPPPLWARLLQEKFEETDNKNCNAALYYSKAFQSCQSYTSTVILKQWEKFHYSYWQMVEGGAARVHLS